MKIFRCVFASVFMILGAPNVQAGLLTFEDLNPSPALFDAMPAPYHSLTFSGWYFGPDTSYSPSSGVIDLFTDYADPGNPTDYIITNANNAITRATVFVFDGAAFSGYSGVTFELWLGSLLVHTSDTIPDAPGAQPYLPTFLSSGYSGFVDKVVINGVQGYYSMDDFVFHEPMGVPEPSSLVLAFIALAGLGFSARYRGLFRGVCRLCVQ